MRGACKRAESECRFAHPQESVSSHEDGSVTVCMDAVKGRCAREPCRYFHPPLHLQAQIKAAQTRATAVWLYYFNPLAKKKIIPKQTKKKIVFCKPITKRIRHNPKMTKISISVFCWCVFFYPFSVAFFLIFRFDMFDHAVRSLRFNVFDLFFLSWEQWFY